MVNELLKSPDEAITHLFLHCCFKDGVVTKGELADISEKLVFTGLNLELNFKDETLRYRAYQPSITNEAAYIDELVSVIRPVNELALYSYCVELCLSDGTLQAAEDRLLQSIASALQLTSDEAATCNKLMVQRDVVLSRKIF